MPQVEQPETIPRLTIEGLLKESAALEECLAQEDLYQAFRDLNIPSDVAGAYEKLGTELLPKEGEKLSLPQRLGQGIKKELWDSYLGRTISGTILVATIAEIIKQGGPVDATRTFVAFFNRAVGWAGETIDKPEAIPIILATSTAILWTVFSPKIYEMISARDSAKTVEAVTLDAKAREKRAAEMGLLQEGNADLRGMVGPNIQIDVGKSDPSALLLINLFHRLGIEVVTYWDQRNILFDINPYWEKTYNDWTNRDTLLKGNVAESLCSITLVSNGDDLFLSSRIQDPKREMQDMTDNEAFGTVNARDAVRKKLSLRPTPHILVTNPQRIIDIGIAKSSSEAFQPKTVSQVVKEKYPHVHLIDPDQLITEELARIAFRGKKDNSNLPLELITNAERKEEYQENLIKVIEEYNQNISAEAQDKQIRLANQDDSLETLSIIYGSNDEDTIMQVESYGPDFSREGKLIAIINDPEKVSRLPENVESICVGEVVFRAIRKKFEELLIQGAIELPSPSQAKSDATA